MTRTRARMRAACLILGSLAAALPVLREVSWVRGVLPLPQFLAAAIFLALTALACARGSRAGSSAGLGAAALAAAAIAALGAWLVMFLGTDAAVFLQNTPGTVAASLSVIVVVLAAASQVAGRPLALVVLFSVVLGYAGQFLPGPLSSPEVPFASYVTYLTLGGGGLLGRAPDIIVGTVLAYVIFAGFFRVAGGSEVVTAAAMRLFHQNGPGTVKASVVASALFGTVSGGATSNVLMSGSYTLPSMRRAGIAPATAAGIEAAASTCGQITPPVMGAVAFFLADLVGVPYATVALAALLPALICYLALFRQANRVASGAPAPPPGIAAPDLPRAAWLFAAPPAAVIVFLLRDTGDVALAGLAGAVACLLVAVLRFGPGGALHRLLSGLETLVANVVQLVVAAAAIGLLLGAIQSSGAAVAASVAMAELGRDGILPALAMAAVTAFILGMGMATIGVYVIVGTMIAPELVNLGLEPLVAHFFVLYCGLLSMITPPVAFASLVASTLAATPFLATAMASMRFGWILFAMPFVIVAQPGLLLIGHGTEIAAAFVITAIFVLVATEARLRPALRLPATAIAAGALIWSGAAGVLTALGVLALSALLTRRQRRLSAVP